MNISGFRPCSFRQRLHSRADPRMAFVRFGTGRRLHQPEPARAMPTGTAGFGAVAIPGTSPGMTGGKRPVRRSPRPPELYSAAFGLTDLRCHHVVAGEA